MPDRVEKKIVRKGEIACHKQCLAPLASYCHCVVPFVRLAVRPSVHSSVNSYFKKLLLRNY